MEPSPSRVFEDTSADLFAFAGNSYLVYVDRRSCWPSLRVWNKRDPTSRDVIRVLWEFFTALGVPVRFWSDNGPQFNSREFTQFLSRWGVQHAPSTPHYPQSNGLAESAVHAMKRLVEKTTNRGDLDDEAFDRGLLEFRILRGRVAYHQTRICLVILFGPLSRQIGRLLQTHGSS